MRIVLFDEELHEALTVIEVPASFMRGAADGSRPRWLCLHVPRFVEVGSFREVAAATMGDIRQVVVRLERVMRDREVIFWFGYPDDPELALQLRAAFLPGQVGEVQRREKDAFWRGAFASAWLR